MSFLDVDDSKDTGSSSFLLSSLASADNPTPQSTDARDAAEEEALLAEFKKNPEAALAFAQSYMNAAQSPRQAMTEITPVPGFVVQTQTTNDSSKVPIGSETVSFPKDTVVFINICSSDLMPKPTKASEAEIQRAINAEEGVTYQVPFQLSPPREYRNQVAKSYLVLDACVHSEAYKRTEKDFDYKLYIMELAMEWVEEKCCVELSRNFQLPNMKSKDEIKKRSVILPKPPTIQELDDGGNEKESAAITSQGSSTKSGISREGKSKDNTVFVPAAGNDDIVPKSRLLPCPKGTLGIIVEIDLPNHKSMENVTLDVVLPDKLILHSKSQGQNIDGGKEYHTEVDLPNEPVDLDAVSAEFNMEKRVLRVYTIKKKRK
ncbi:PIH1 domain-containing protein 1 [Mortierella sp. GBA30]|nr:PIH1 domain-containing protein 1 [Mortierella sp. GBA30]